MLTNDDSHDFAGNRAVIVKAYSNALIDDLYRIVITEPQPDMSHPHLDRVKIDLNADQMRELIRQSATALHNAEQEQKAIAHAY